MQERIIKLLIEGKTHREIRDLTGVSLGTISNIRKKIGEDYIQSNRNKDTVNTESEIKTRTPIPKETDKLLKFHGYNPQFYSLTSSKHSQWEQQSKDGIITMYSSKVSVKPKEQVIEPIDVEEALKNITVTKLREPSEYDERLKASKLASIEINDLHLGKLGWGEETTTDYDMKIAERGFYDRVEYFANKIEKDGEIESILFVLGNDFFHYDNEKIETFHGTKQDTDTRPKKMFKKGLDMVCTALLRLEKISPVEVVLVAGNHSSTIIFYLAVALEKAFKDNPNITIDTSPKARKYIKYGQNLLGFAHSDEENKKELEGLMQKEVPKLWGETKHREFHFGHIHIEKVIEKHGLKFRWCPSISGIDNWHYKKGYIQTERVAQCFIYDKEKGLTEIWYR